MYNKKITKEIKELIKKEGLDYTIREFENKVNWDWISVYQVLSEGFIGEFESKVDWYGISKYQVLSEGFIREFKSKVNWYSISECQVLSEGFIREFENKVDIDVYKAVNENKSLVLPGNWGKGVLPFPLYPASKHI